MILFSTYYLNALSLSAKPRNWIQISRLHLLMIEKEERKKKAYITPQNQQIKHYIQAVSSKLNSFGHCHC